MKRKPDIDLGGAAMTTPSVPIPPPELLARAKQLGAVSAGPANLGMEFAAAALTSAPLRPGKQRLKAKRKRPNR